MRVAMHPGASDLHYDVTLAYADGSRVQTRVFAPNQLGQAQDGTPELSPTGWLRVHDADGAVQTDGPQATEYQQAFRSIVDTVRQHAWGA
ncbi:peptidase M14, partial [Cupriavidus sp. SIMBA_020]